ncbi:MAG TPA: hypothetical protein VIY48_14130 [Candidatus Paceibacterota bacterium]
MVQGTAVHYAVEYLEEGFVTPHAIYADEIRVYTAPDDVCALTIRRTPHGKWRVSGGEFAVIPDDMWEMSYPDLDSVLSELEVVWNVTFASD